MAVIEGYGRMAGIPVQTVRTSPVNNGAPTMSPNTTTTVRPIDGTPARVVTLALASAVGLFALRVAGFRFNVGVSA
jgi:hypothetical protein